MKKFYYMTDGKTRQGPLEYAVLLQMKKSKALPGTTRICAEDSSVWRPMGSNSITNGIVYTVCGIILVGFVGYLLDQHSSDVAKTQTDAESQMAQKVLASGAIENSEAESDYNDATNSLKAGSYQAALIQLNGAISVKPGDPRFFYARAKAKQGLGDQDGAAADTKAADDLSHKVAAPPAQ